MINIAVFCPSMTDATSFYRGIGPLAALRKKYRGKINLTFFDNVNWSTLSMNDIVFMQRPFSGKHVAIAELAKDYGLPLWIDYDDDLFTVPTDNPTYAQYNTDEVKRGIVKIAVMADVITVSTNFLKERYDDIARQTGVKLDVRVINNAFNFSLFSMKEYWTEERSNCITWRGSRTHHRDVAHFSKEISELAHKHEDHLWHFVGDNLWFLTDTMPQKNVQWTEAIEYAHYLRHLQKIKPKAMIVPLHDSPFNRCKSNIAYLEATAIGALTIAPEWEEWKRPGVATYRTKAEFKDILSDVLNDKVDYKRLIRESMDDVISHYNLSIVNEKRAKVINDICTSKLKISNPL